MKVKKPNGVGRATSIQSPERVEVIKKWSALKYKGGNMNTGPSRNKFSPTKGMPEFTSSIN
jgi:hypothetical protein